MSTVTAIKDTGATLKNTATAVATQALHVGAGAGDLAIVAARTKATALVEATKGHVTQGAAKVTTAYRDLAARGEAVLAKGAGVVDADPESPAPATEASGGE